MLSSTNFWMSFAGLIYLVAGVFILRKEIRAARGWDKLITLGCVFIAVPLAVFATEHFRGARSIQNMVPSWMPAHLFWAYFVGCALFAAATSLTVTKFVRLSSTLLGWRLSLWTGHMLSDLLGRISAVEEGSMESRSMNFFYVATSERNSDGTKLRFLSYPTIEDGP